MTKFSADCLSHRFSFYSLLNNSKCSIECSFPANQSCISNLHRPSSIAHSISLGTKVDSLTTHASSSPNIITFHIFQASFASSFNLLTTFTLKEKSGKHFPKAMSLSYISTNIHFGSELSAL